MKQELTHPIPLSIADECAGIGHSRLWFRDARLPRYFRQRVSEGEVNGFARYVTVNQGWWFKRASEVHLWEKAIRSFIMLNKFSASWTSWFFNANCNSLLRSSQQIASSSSSVTKTVRDSAPNRALSSSIEGPKSRTRCCMTSNVES